MKTVTYYVVTYRRLLGILILSGGILVGIGLDDAMVGGFDSYFGKLHCEKIVFPDSKTRCDSLRISSIEWFLIMPAISGFLAFAIYAQRAFQR